MNFEKQENNVSENDIESGHQQPNINNYLLGEIVKIEKENHTKYKTLLDKLNDINRKIGWVLLFVLVLWFFMFMHFNDLSSEFNKKIDNYDKFHCIINDDNQTITCSIMPKE